MKYIAAVGLVAILAVALAEVDKWAWSTNYGAEITISCNNTRFMYETADNITWILPDKDGVGVGLGWTDDTREVKGTKGELMHIKDVKPSNSGIYTCLLHMGGTIYSVKRALNLGGPSVNDIWEKYQTNVMIGGIAAGSCLAFFIIACLIYKFRYKEIGTPKFHDTSMATFENWKHKHEPHVYDNPSDVTQDETKHAANGNATDDTRM